MIKLLASPVIVKNLGAGMTVIGAVCNLAGNHLGKLQQDTKAVEAAEKMVEKMNIPKMVEDLVAKRMKELGK